MLSVLVVLAFGASYYLLPALAEMAQARLMHFNYANQEVPVGLGMLFIIVVIPLILIGILFQKINLLFGFLAVLTILAFGIVGFIDDTLGSREARGFRGHFRALLQGQLTTGALKAIFGGLIALLLGFFTAEHGLIVIINGLLIALMANFANLLDVRPGRTGKFYILSTALLFFFGESNPVSLILLASVLAYLPWDLHGQVMMGDIGSNILGSVLGLVVTQLPVISKLVILFSLVGLHYYAERKSFTLVIENNRFLNYLDLIGRKKL
ncbi:MAG: UDP-N-acetylmuramyl pentapeptide phosphotransferase [Firmicutes bacterium]|nr:UDP-N-acetylmuramyl pentapeptide phosphotransferase [Bacillota bacterium]